MSRAANRFPMVAPLSSAARMPLPLATMALATAARSTCSCGGSSLMRFLRSISDARSRPSTLPGRGGPATRTKPSWGSAATWARNSPAVGDSSSPDRDTRCQARWRGSVGQRHSSRVPSSNSRATASREMRVMPVPPAPTPGERRSTRGSGWPRGHAQLVEELLGGAAGTRARLPQEEDLAGKLVQRDLPHAVRPRTGRATSTRTLGRVARVTNRPPPGGRPPMARSTSRSASSSHSRSRLPTSSDTSAWGWRARKEARKRGRTCSPAVVTAARRTRPLSGSSVSRAAATPSSAIRSTPRA